MAETRNSYVNFSRLSRQGIDTRSGYSYSKPMPTLTVYVTKQLEAKLREHPEIPKSAVAARAWWRQVKRIEKQNGQREPQEAEA